MDKKRHEGIIGAVARGWGHPKNSTKVVDVDLTMAIVAEIESVLISEETECQT